MRSLAMGYDSALIMYNSVLVSTLFYNCQAWSNITKEDVLKLERMQLKFLKRIMQAPMSTTNCFVFLEFGVLPTKYVIDIRQLTFLHHICNLDSDDPVKQVYESQKKLPYEKNWANNIITVIEKYDLGEPAARINRMNKNGWKKLVKSSVSNQAFIQMTNECRSKSKTSSLSYNSLKRQSYLYEYNTNHAKMIFKFRSRTISCKVNQKSSFTDLKCRLCKSCEETQDHIINCQAVRQDDEVLEIMDMTESKVFQQGRKLQKV